MGYTKMNRHNYPDIEGLTEAERAKLDHIDDIEDDLADAYDSTATYAVGDWCIRNGKLYECITAITTAEPFDSTKWRRVTVAELKSNLTNLNKVKTTGTAILGLNDAGTDYTIQKQGVVTITATLGSGADPYIRFIINSIRRWQVYSGNYSIAHVYDMSFPVFADDVVSFAHNRASAVTVTFYELN